MSVPLRAAEVLERIGQYLNNGGFFNPDLMDHNNVRDLIMDARDVLEQSHAILRALQLAAGTDAEGDELVLAIRRLRMREAPHYQSCACGAHMLGSEDAKGHLW